MNDRIVYDTTILFGVAAAGYGLFLSSIDQVTDADLVNRSRRMRQAEAIVTGLTLVFGWMLNRARGNSNGLIAACLVSVFYISVFEYVAAKPEQWM